MKESDFQEWWRQLMETYGWLNYHTYRPVRSPAGFPDNVAVRGDRVVYAELKSEKGQPSAEQYEWLELLAGAECEAYLFRPDDRDFIEKLME